MAGDLYRLIKNFLSLATGQVIVRALNVVATLYAIKVLGPSAYGVLSSGLALALVVSITANMGLGDYLTLNVARFPDDAGMLLGDILLAKILFFPVILAGFVVLAVANPDLVAMYALLMAYSVAHSYFMLICATFRGLEQMEYQTLLMLGQTALMLAGSVAAIRLTNDPTFVALGYLASSALGAAWGYWLLCKRGVRPRYRWSPPRWRALIQAGLPFGLIFIYGMAHDRLPSIFLPFLASDEVAGWYNAVYNIVVILTTIPGVTMGAVFPFLARKAHDSPGAPAYITTMVIKYTNVVSIGVAVALYIAAPVVVPILFNADYLPSIDILRILSVGVPFLFLASTLISVLSAVDQQRLCSRYSGYALIVAAPLCWIMIRLWGYRSGALAYVLNVVILTVLFVALTVRKIEGVHLGTACVRPVVSATAMIALAWIGRAWPLYLSLPGAALLYGVGLLLTGTVGRLEIDVARSFLETRFGKSQGVA